MALVKPNLPPNYRSILRSALNPQQLASFDDTCMLEGISCSRRAGKSTLLGFDYVDSCILGEGRTHLLLGRTNTTIERIYVRDVFKPVLDLLQLEDKKHYKYYKTTYTYEFWNGSVIYMGGSDSSPSQMNNFLGQKYDRASVDEAPFFTTVPLKPLVEEYLEIAVAEKGGKLRLLGTPEPGEAEDASFFRLVSSGGHPRWTSRFWTWKDNPAVRDKLQAAHDEILAKEPEKINDPGFRAHWYGEWPELTGVGRRTYPPVAGLAPTPDLPVVNPAPIQVIRAASLDIGTHDGCAITVGELDYDTGVLTYLESRKRVGLTVPELAKWLNDQWDKYEFAYCVADTGGIGAMVVATLQKDLPHILFKPAIKTNKPGAIRGLNAYRSDGRIALRESARELHDEWNSLRSSSTHLEVPSDENDRSDTALYLWRALAPWARPEPKQETQDDESTKKKFFDAPSY